MRKDEMAPKDGRIDDGAMGVMMHGGRMMKILSGGKMAPMKTAVTMSDGTRVMKDGKVMMKDGTRRTLSDGDVVSIDGMMSKISSDHVAGEPAFRPARAFSKDLRPRPL